MEDKKIWFRRKTYGWGWTPCTWQGWLLTLGFVGAIVVLAFALGKNSSPQHAILTFFLPVAALIVAFIAIAYKKGESPRWQWGGQGASAPKRVLMVLALAAIVGAVFLFRWYRLLEVAHSTFDDYYRFRGCQELVEKTDTYGICKISDGKTIKIVLIGGKWYLENDGPGVW